jgi:hypothetical protein
MTTRTITVAALAAACLALAAAPAQAAQKFDVTGTVSAPNASGTTFRQSGSFSGAPLGPGSMRVSAEVGKGRGALVSFRMFNRRGQVWGNGNVKVTFAGTRISYDGTASITGGSGAFARIRAKRLHITGGGSLDSSFKLRLTGLATS